MVQARGGEAFWIGARGGWVQIWVSGSESGEGIGGMSFFFFESWLRT
jgi:hypothetical protein